MRAHRLRILADLVKNTPLHPQWLLGQGLKQEGLMRQARGQILDIGCADRWLESVLPAGCHYVGLDYPPTGAALYHAKPDVFADAAALPFPAGSFDTVVLFEVLEHVERPRQALMEAARILKSQGRLLLTMPFLYPIHDEPHDYQRYTKYGLAREADRAGLRIEQITPVLGSAETAGLTLCLALAGMLVAAMEKRALSILLLPLIVSLVPLINVFAWLAGRLLPSWPALTSGYQLVATKP